LKEEEEEEEEFLCEKMKGPAFSPSYEIF